MADYNSAFTGAQIDAAVGLANTAVQSDDLATVATSGAYADLSGLPTLGTAAATDATDYATAAQGALADSAIQSDVTGITGADAIANIVSLTQAEYDAIGTPNAATLYVVV